MLLINKKINSLVWFLKFVLILPLTLWVSACATTSIFDPYPHQIADVKTKIEQRSFEKPLKFLDKQRDSQDRTLYMLERGRVSQLQGEPDVSVKDFALAIKTESIADEKAVVSASDTAAKGAALITNDNAIPYRAASYERVMMHHYQAINYLMKKDLEGAGVEVRRAALEQRDALERHNKEVAEAENKAREKKYDPSRHNEQVNRRFAAMYAAASDVKNSFQNAYTFYLSGLIYEKLGEPNDAYIDYKKALEIFPDNPVLHKDLLRLAKLLGFREDYDIFEKKFGQQVSSSGIKQGDVVILYEEGYVPVKDQVGIPLGTHNTIHTVAFPVYRDISSHRGALTLNTTAGDILKTSLICDFRALAVKDLQEKMTGIIIRQVLRLIAKNGVRKTADEHLGPAGAIAAILFNLISEQADRRSWLTLPRNAQILRVSLPVGQQMLRINAANGKKDQINIDVKENGLSIIHVVGTRKQLFTRVL